MFSSLRIGWLVLLSALSIRLCAQPDTVAYPVVPERQVNELTNFTEIFVDTTGSLDIQAILSSNRSLGFSPLSTYNGSFKADYHYWLRVELAPETDLDDWWLIVKSSEPEYGYFSWWDEMDLYQVDRAGNVIGYQRSGVEVPKSQKTLKREAGFVAGEISLSKDQEQTIYIRLSNTITSTVNSRIELELRDPDLGIPHHINVHILFMLSAVAAIMSLLSLFFFVFVKEKAYLYFFVYTLFLSLHYLILNPFLPFINWFIPEHPYLVLYCFQFFAMGGFIFFMLFGRSFINLPALSKQTDRFLVWFLALWAAVIVSELILMAVFQRMVLYPAAYFIVVIAIAIIVRIAFFKSIFARFFVAGAAWLLMFTLFGFLLEPQLQAIGINPWPVGQVGQMLIYMVGLAYKIRMNERARAAAERIKEMDGIKSRFFANISHEFRTPLTLISGHLQQIEEQSPSFKSKETAIVPARQINTMRRNADRLLELVNQLLDLSRLDSGKMQLQLIKGDVLQVLKALSHAFDSIAERKQIHYHIHFPESTRIAFFDKDKLEKIFTNLLSNAFKYTPERGTVSVNVEMHDNRLRMSVSDSGPGISKKELDKIFDRFYQVEGTEDKGSGIGLALVKELVDLYRGQISVSSDPGKGSEFRISLPIDKKDFHENEFVYGEWKAEETLVRKDFEGEEQNIENSALRPELPLLLIVEDNLDLRQFIHEALQAQFNILEATNGVEGLEAAVREVPDIIISDVMMPVMDGFAMTEKLKKDERTSHIPVILLTAKAGQPHKIEGLETGADDYITKPFEVKELIVRTQNLVAQRKLLRKKFAGQIQLKPSEVTVKSIDESFLIRVMESIEKHLAEEEFGVEQLAREVTMSRSQLHRKLVALIDKSPSELLRQTRLLRAKELLQKKAGTPSEVAFQVGFNSHTYFSKCFKEEFGMSPSEI